jgi:hypothetical protein
MMIFHVIRRELAARWILLPASIVIGALTMIAIRSIGHVRGDADGIMNGTWVGTLVVSTIVGMSLLADELSNSRLSFYFARPFSPHAIFGGKLVAGVFLALVMQIAIVVLIAVALPELSWRGSDLAQRSALSVGAERVVATIGCTLLGMAASIVSGSKTRWVVIDVLGVVVVGVIGTWFALRLGPDPAWLPEDSIRSPNNKAFFHSAAFAVIAVGLGVATARALVRGRTDRMRAHQTLSTTLWPILVPAMVLLVFVGKATVPDVPDPPAIAISVPEVRDGPIYDRGETPMPYLFFVAKDSIRIGAAASWAKLDRKLVRLSKPFETYRFSDVFFGAVFNPDGDHEQTLDNFFSRRTEDASGGLAVASVSLFDAKIDRILKVERERESSYALYAAYRLDLVAMFAERRRARIEDAIRIQTLELARAVAVLGLVVDANSPLLHRRYPTIFGAMQHASDRRHRNELAVAAPAEMAKHLIDAVAMTGTSIAVSRAGQIRPLDIDFRGYHERGDKRWIELRISSKTIVVQAMPDNPIEAADIKGVASALSTVQASSRIDAREPVDVLVGSDVDVQRFVDLLVALYNARVQMVGVSHMPDLQDLVLRGRHIPTISLSMTDLVRTGRWNDDTVVRNSLPRILRCYNDGLAFKTFPPNTVRVVLAIDLDGKPSLSAAGLVPGLAKCVGSVLETLEFSKRTTWDSYRRLMPTPSRYKIELAFTP